MRKLKTFGVAFLALLLGASGGLLPGCVTLSNPGAYTLDEEAARAKAEASSPMRVGLAPFVWASGSTAKGDALSEERIRQQLPRTPETARLDEAFAAHLRARGLFAEVAAADAPGLDLILQGEILKLAQPGGSGNSSYSGGGELILVVLILMGVAALFGVPTDCRAAEASLRLCLCEPVHGVALECQEAQATGSDCAGLYYDGWPLAEALRLSAESLLGELESRLPDAKQALARLERWTEAYGLDALALDDPAHLPRLIQALGDKEPAVRARAAAAIGALGPAGRGAVEALRLVLKDPRPALRRVAVWALEMQAVPDLKLSQDLENMARRDASLEVRQAAARAHRVLRFAAEAEKLSPELAAFVRDLGAPEPVRRTEALRALSVLGVAAAAAQPALLLALDDESAELRMQVLACLDKVGSFSDGLNQRLRKLAGSDPDPGVKQAAYDLHRRLQFSALAQSSSEPRPAARIIVAPRPEASPREALNEALAPARGTVVAVFDVEDASLKIKRRTLGQVGDYLAARLAVDCGWRIIPRTQIKQNLRAAKSESHRRCYDESCQIELGRALAADKALATRILRVGERCAVTATLFDLKSETAEAAATVQTACGEDELMGSMDRIAGQFKGRMNK